MINRPIINKLHHVILWLTHFYDTILSRGIELRAGDNTVGDSKWSTNLNMKWYRVSDTGTANTEFTVTHDLGRVPVGYLLIRNSVSGNLIESDFTNWTSTSVKFKHSGANAGITIGLF